MAASSCASFKYNRTLVLEVEIRRINVSLCLFPFFTSKWVCEGERLERALCQTSSEMNAVWSTHTYQLVRERPQEGTEKRAATVMNDLQCCCSDQWLCFKGQRQRDEGQTVVTAWDNVHSSSLLSPITIEESVFGPMTACTALHLFLLSYSLSSMKRGNDTCMH